ncbi:MAG: cell division protein ZapA [Gammaproteobacteria bacterium]|nr:cell division protein ZapA [Gammaproteobacteria bacterium]MCK5091881.1 cell division protein ZapA [Gammaproteobacteria bacterium]
MSMDKPVSVKILDKEYLISCPEDEQDSLRKTARFLDSKMKEIRESGKVIGADRIAVMAALNISHDLLQNKSQKDGLNKTMCTRIKALQDKIEVAINKGKQMEL